MLSDQWLLTNAPPRLKSVSNNSFGSAPQAACKWQFSTIDSFAACWCVMAQTTLDPFVRSSERPQWQSRINAAKKHTPNDSVPDTTKAIRLLRQSEMNRRAERKLFQQGSGFVITIPTKLPEIELNALELLAVWTDFALAVVAGSTARQSIAAVTFSLSADDTSAVSMEVLTSGSCPSDLEAEALAWLPEALRPHVDISGLQCKTPVTDEGLGASCSSLAMESLPPSMATSAANSIAPELSLPLKETTPAAMAKKDKKDPKKDEPKKSGTEEKKPKEVESLKEKKGTEPAKEKAKEKGSKKAAATAPPAAAAAPEDTEAQAAATFIKEAEQRAKKLDSLCRNLNDEKANLDKLVADAMKESKDIPLDFVAEFNNVVVNEATQKLIDGKPTPTFAASTPKLAKLAAGSQRSRDDMQRTQDTQMENFNAAILAMKQRTQRTKVLLSGLGERRVIEQQCAQRTACIAGNIKKQVPARTETPPPEVKKELKNEQPAAAAPAKQPQTKKEKKAANKKDQSKVSPSKKDQQQKTAVQTAQPAAKKSVSLWKDNDKLFKIGILSLVALLLAVVAAALWE